MVPNDPFYVSERLPSLISHSQEMAPEGSQGRKKKDLPQELHHVFDQMAQLGVQDQHLFLSLSSLPVLRTSIIYSL